jgi:hypothetical protein
MASRRISEPRLRVGVGIILWGISGILTAGLFLDLAGDDLPRRIIMISLALGLEGAKVLTWRMGKGYRILAISLIVLSMLASFDAAIQTVVTARNSGDRQALASVRQDQVYLDRQGQIASIDRQIEALVAKLEAMPPEYATASRQLSTEIQSLRRSRQSLDTELIGLTKTPQTSAAGTGMFDLLGTTLHLPRDSIMLAILLFLAINLEVAALVLAGKYPGPATGPTRPINVSQPVTPVTTNGPPFPAVSLSEFLIVAADGSDLPFLHGRETTARKLGLGSYRAKKAVRQLQAKGIIKPQGKRLFLCTPNLEDALAQLED